MKSKKKIVLAYSGGLDTSIILKWLQENYDADQNSLTNVGEIELIQKVIEQFQFKPEFTAIISPYSAQVNLLKSSFSGFRCSTMDSFQGQ